MTADERRSASGRIVERLSGLHALRQAAVVLLYAPTEDEADPTGLLPMLHGQGTRTLFPRVRQTDLEPVEARDLTTLTLGFQGIREPVGPMIDASLVDVVLIPGVAFDLVGGRLGHGGGHYDRFLPALRDDALRVGLGFSCQLVPRVPREEHDQVLDLVVTESGRYVTRAREDDSLA